VLGAGFGRTGTLSLKHALEILGFAPCYHMVEIARHPNHALAWTGAMRGEPTDWRTVLHGYAAAVDWPATAFWRELISAYPNARVILTVRDSAAWYASFRDTVVESMTGLAPPRDTPLRAIYDLTRELILDSVFGGHAGDELRSRAIYDAHNRSVIDSVEPERLLIFNFASGWAPLCSFLDRPVPQKPFPHLNTRATFLRQDFGGAVRRSRVTPS
jgi:hypothetical protein